MNAEDLLTDLFAHQADGRPESGAVLDAVHERIAHQRRVTITRAATVLGAAAAVAAVAIGVSVATEPSGHRSAPAGGPAAPTSSSPAPAPTRPASSAPAPRSTASTLRPPSSAATSTRPPSPSTAPSHARGGEAGTYSTINAGWLPGPAIQQASGTSVQPGFEERDWTVTVDGVAMDVIIWTESGSLPTRMQATGGGSDYRQITVNGHPGREFVSASITIVAFDLGNGTIAYTGPSVTHTTAKVTTERIAAIAVKVADNMQFDRHDPIPGQ